MKHYLQELGAGVVRSRFGKALGGGLYEFRLDLDLPELLRHVGIEYQKRAGDGGPEAVLLRVFFAVEGNRIIVLLGGYDKGRSPAAREQQRQIARARNRLADHRKRNQM